MHTVPGMVENLACSRSSPSELTFTWQSPMNMLQDSILEYQVEVNGLRNREGTRDVVQFDVTGFNTGSRAATINQGLSKHHQN